MRDPKRPYQVEPIAVSEESTVVAEYAPEIGRETAYQSENDLEQAFIGILRRQAYEYLPVKAEAELVTNLRAQLGRLNDYAFSDSEWDLMFRGWIAKSGDSIVDKTVRIQEDFQYPLKRDDGTTKNISLLDKQNIHNNHLQVINQYEATGTRVNRYDVTVLVNGLPLVHIELKRRGVNIVEAFNQINRYQRDSFWAGSGLFEYVQLFVISNGTFTKYYSNTTRRRHVDDVNGAKRVQKTSNSFEFTSWWADEKNHPIQDLESFAKTFFAKHTLLNILTRYCVFTAEKSLLVMRPYQIAATEKIIQRIGIGNNARRLGTVLKGGYIWHTTGSGKTLTSFKAAQLASRIVGIDKVLFVVDRKDLDYQTMKEYDRFEKGAANSNHSTRELKRQLGDSKSRIIVTTIQKLATFIAANKGHAIYDGRIVIIFDECHRSQFGDMHRAITKAFKNYQLFGFTGTPIFKQNMAKGSKVLLKTTEQVFGDQLHTYTIVNAISDKNVLPFLIDYVNTVKVGNVHDKKVKAIDTERALLSEKRIRLVVEHILAKFDDKTKRNHAYNLEDKRVSGFNALFATASIDAARLYYAEFKRQLQGWLPGTKLKVGVIFSYAANQAETDGVLDEEEFEVGDLSAPDRDFLEEAIKDFNEMFAAAYDTSSDNFQNYYKDVSNRVKKRELDLLIVVNMFLTGFDATTLNTLFVDKNLRDHGLLQAFSRTNRILNSVKACGNIVSYRNLEAETNASLALFGDAEAKSIAIIKPFADYYKEYKRQVTELTKKFPVGVPITSEAAQKEFLSEFGFILRLQNILTSFDAFEGKELLSQRDIQDYQSVYLDIYTTLRQQKSADKESILDDIVFEIELIKQVEINVDYILKLVDDYRKRKGDKEGEDIRAQIRRAVDASPTLRNKKDLIEAFVDSVSASSEVGPEWREFIEKCRAEELELIIQEENLKPDKTQRYIAAAFQSGRLQTAGTEIVSILPPTSRFAKTDGHSEKKQRVIDKLSAFFDRFFGLLAYREVEDE